MSTRRIGPTDTYRETPTHMPDGLIAGTEPVEKARAYPIGIDVFNIERQRFLTSFREFMFDSRIPAGLRQREYLSTVSAMTQIAVSSEVE
jgi:hypothetical protein